PRTRIARERQVCVDYGPRRKQGRALGAEGLGRQEQGCLSAPCKCEEADGRFSPEISPALAIRYAHLAGEHVRRSVRHRYGTATAERRGGTSRSAVADRARKRPSEWAALGASHLGWRSTHAEGGVPRTAVRSSSDASS